MSFYSLLAVAAGGALGAIFRFLISYSAVCFSLSFSISFFTIPLLLTLFINAFGSFAFAYFSHSFALDSLIRYFLFIGFFGGFTTFSTFSFEAVSLFTNKGIYATLLFVSISNLLICSFAILGFYLGRPS